MLRTARLIGVACLALLTTVLLTMAATVSSAVQLVATTALIMSGTFTPTPPPAFVDMAKNQFILPTHPGVDFAAFVPVTTPEQAFPVTGLSDLPFGESVAAGLTDLEAAMAEHGNDNLVIFGHSQSSVIAYLEKRRLAEQFPIGTPAPDIDFVTIGTLNLPNGGVMTRFWGLYLPIVDFYFNGPAPTDTQFDTYIITQRWDGFADFPIYPIVLPAVLNAVAGFFYTHENYAAVTLAPDPSKHFVGKFGDTSYYFFETQDLPLFGPLRGLGVPESLIDVVEPLTEFVVELGYRRDIPPWVPSPARLIPIHDPVKVVGDFVRALEETVDNTSALLGPPAPALPAPAPIASSPSVATMTSQPFTASQPVTASPPESTTPRQTAPAQIAESEPATGGNEPGAFERERPARSDKGSAGAKFAGSAADDLTTSSSTTGGRFGPTTDALGPDIDGRESTAKPSGNSPSSGPSAAKSSASGAKGSVSAA